MVFSVHEHSWYLSNVLISFSYKDISQIGLGLTLMTSFYLNFLFKALSPNKITSKVLGARASTYNLGVEE